MRNGEFLADFGPVNQWQIIDWLINDYCQRSSDPKRAAIEWLAGEVMCSEWVPVRGYATPGGDPVFKCRACGGHEHVYGIEHRYNRRVICPDCGCFMTYPIGGDSQ